MGSSTFSDKVAKETEAIKEGAVHLGTEIKEGATHAVDSLKEGVHNVADKVKGIFGHHDTPAPAAEAEAPAPTTDGK